MRLIQILLCCVFFSSTYAQNESNKEQSADFNNYKIVVEKKIWSGKGISPYSNTLRDMKSTGTTYQKEVIKIFPELDGKKIVTGKKEADYIVVIRQYRPELHTVDYVELDQYSITSRYSFNITYSQKIEICIYDKDGKLFKSQFVNNNNDEYQQSFSKVLANPTYAINVNETPQGFSQMIREAPEKYLKLNDRIKEALATYTGDSHVSVQ